MVKKESNQNKQVWIRWSIGIFLTIIIIVLSIYFGGNSEGDIEITNSLDTFINTGDIDIDVNNSSDVFINTGKIDIDVNPTVGIPEPNLSIKEISSNQLINDLYKTELLLTIDSSVSIPQLYFEVRAPTIIEMEIIPQRTGMSQTGHNGKREGYIFTNLINAHGSYKIIIITKQIEFFNIAYDY